ncbi:MAG: hypothetical protein IPJ78_10245 [Gemmatimonadetes bacterium]|nr:hypothetical protein [Gemmatimonadota bacterium]
MPFVTGTRWSGSRVAIQTFHWAPGGGGAPQLWSQVVDERLREADALRDEIEALAGSDDTREKQRLLKDADGALRNTRLVGDAVIAAFFGADRDRRREGLRQEYEQLAGQALGGKDLFRLEELAADLRRRHLEPFHWEVEFPEVFAGTTGGFDAIIGNPPFAGHVMIVSANPPEYTSWLRMVYAGAEGKCDLVAYFFRRSFELLRAGGAFGLIATNTIAQGDTRNSGLRRMCEAGCTLFSVRRRYRWPGMAAVVVSVVHGIRGDYIGQKDIDGSRVDTITAFLFHAGGNEDPRRLPENVGGSFVGSYILGMGFTFDDDSRGAASSLEEMRVLLAAEPRYQAVIKPFLGGEEINSQSTHTHRRYVIDLGVLTEEAAWHEWPRAMEILERRVKPERLRSSAESGSSHGGRALLWWQHYHGAAELYRTLSGKARTLACSAVSSRFQVTFVKTGSVFAHSAIVFPSDRYETFACLQSRPHELWARFFGSSMKDDLRYTPTDCFETFPFPLDHRESTDLEQAGRECYEYRAELMVARNQGLTDTYNRFHDPADTSGDTERLRVLHAAMDRAVLDAYGWTDLLPEAESVPEFDEDEIEPGTRARRKYRLRWPDEVRDEVLARLLKLNRQRSTGQH